MKEPQKVNFRDSGKHKTLRLVLFVACIALAACAFTYMIVSLLSQERGWTAITVRNETEDTCAGDFSLQYELTDKPTTDYKAIQSLYTSACEKAYAVFHATREIVTTYDGTVIKGSLATLNHSPNEDVEVDPLLYEALSKIDAAGDRTLFNGPYFELYDNLFHCSEDYETVNYDPQQNSEVAEYFQELSAFITSPADISITLLGDNKVRLNVSLEYLSFAEENGISTFVDLYWMKNAFICDYLADVLMENGYTNGYLVSVDGYTRNLDQRGTGYSMNIFERKQNQDGDSSASDKSSAGYTVSNVGTLTYTGPMALVVYKNYTTQDSVGDHYYMMENGDSRYPYITNEGYPQSAVSYLVVYSSGASCADLVLAFDKLYIASSLDEDMMEDLASEGIFCAYGKDGEAVSTDPDASWLETPENS